MSDTAATARHRPARIAAATMNRNRSFPTPRRLRLNAVLIAAGLLLPAALAQAKCASMAYELDGRVVAADGTAVADAAVSASWKDYFGPHAEHATTTADGRFRLSLRIGGYVGGNWLTGDRCGQFTKTVNVTVDSAGHATVSHDLELTAPTLQADFTLR